VVVVMHCRLQRANQRPGRGPRHI